MKMKTRANRKIAANGVGLSYHKNNIIRKHCKQNEICRKRKLRMANIHYQIVTNRKRSLFVELINNDIAMLIIETSIIHFTLKHKSDGTLKKSNLIENVSDNFGIISQYSCTDLVKLIHSNDIPTILAEFEAGKPLNEIKYSSCPVPMLIANNYPPIQTSQNLISLPLIDINNNNFNEDNCSMEQTKKEEAKNANLHWLNRLFHINTMSFHMSAYKTTTLTYRYIKNICTNLFHL